MTGFLIFVLGVAVIVLFSKLTDTNSRVTLLEQNISWMRHELDRLRKAAKEHAAAHEAASGVRAEARAPEVMAPAVDARSPRPEAPAPPSSVVDEVFASPEAGVPESEATEESFPRAAAFSAEAAPSSASAAAAEESPAAMAPVAPPPSSRGPIDATPQPTAAAERGFDWEALVGVKLFSWIAGIALVLAAIFFLRYSVQQGWLSPVVRASIGLLVSASLIVICELRVARPYAMTANSMHGAAIAILYATLFATHALWHLMPATAVFALMIVVTAVAVLLSIRRDSIFIAMLGLIGGFATPALLSSGENRPFGLFGYLLLLNIGLALVGYRKRWPALTTVSIVATGLYEWGWISKFLTPEQMPLAVGIFIVFAAIATTALWTGRSKDRQQSTFDQAALIGSIAPFLFAVYAAAVPAYGARYNLLFGFLLLLAVGLAVIAFTRGPDWLHILGGATVLAVFALWFGRSWTPEAWPVVLAWIAAFVALYLAAGVRFESAGVYAAPLLFFTFAALIVIGATGGNVLLLFGCVFVLLAATAAVAIRRLEGPVYYVAAFFVIASEAIWSVKYLNRDRLLAGLALYGIFALFFLGVPLVARRFGRGMEPRGALAALVLTSIAVLLFLTTEGVADSALWGLAILLGVLNLGALLESRESSHPVLAATSMILSWIVIAVWWSSATITAALVPALMIVGGFSVLVVAGNLWASRESAKRSQFENSVYLALAGHLFLLFVATQTTLAIPPWPLFAILAVLDFALAVAALYVRRSALLTAPLAASQLILLVWGLAATQHGWSHVTLIATIVVSVLGLVWFRLDRRFGESALAALVGAYVVAIAAGLNSATPLYASLLAAVAAITIAMLVVAAVTEWQVLAVVAAIATGAATYLARTETPSQFFTFGAVLYALLIAYPLILGRWVKRHFEPHLAAVVASGWFFFVARDAMVRSDLGAIIGVLPVGEATVLLLVLLRLLRSETREKRLLSRLALIAGAALAFITAAIPLQLDKQWITIGWALEGAALAWLFTRIPHRGLLAWSGGLLAAVVIRLALNPAVLAYHPPSTVAVVNWFLYTYLLAAASMFVAARYFPPDLRQAIAGLYSAGTLLLFLLLNIEIADFYSHGPTLTFNFFSSSLAQDLTYTMGWAVFAIAMLIAGIVFVTHATRIAAIALLLVTILKCFLHDLARLGGLYRVGSLLGLAVSLVATGILLQKFVMHKTKQEASTP